MSVNWKTIALDLEDSANEVLANIYEANADIDEETGETFSDVAALKQAVDNCNERR